MESNTYKGIYMTHSNMNNCNNNNNVMPALQINTQGKLVNYSYLMIHADYKYISEC